MCNTIQNEDIIYHIYKILDVNSCKIRFLYVSQRIPRSLLLVFLIILFNHAFFTRILDVYVRSLDVALFQLVIRSPCLHNHT